MKLINPPMRFHLLRRELIAFLTILMMGSGLQAMDWIASAYNYAFPSKEDQLFEAVKNLNYPEVERLIRAGANVDAQDKDGDTPLIRLLQFRGAEGTKMVLLLIENGANPNIQNKRGKTALMFGCWQNSLKPSEVLIEKGADMSLQDNEGNTALLLAVRGHYKTSHLLIDKGADVNIRNNEGNTALILASRYSLLNVCVELIANGADINAKNNKGNTALLEIAKRLYYNTRYYDLCQLLIDNGADATLLNRKGKSALVIVANIPRSNFNLINEAKYGLCKSLIRAMLKPTKEQKNSVIALLGLSKRGKIKELNLAGKDVVKMIGRDRLDAIKCENREKTRAEIMKIEHRDALRNELLRYLEEQIATQKINC